MRRLLLIAILSSVFSLTGGCNPSENYVKEKAASPEAQEKRQNVSESSHLRADVGPDGRALPPAPYPTLDATMANQPDGIMKDGSQAPDSKGIFKGWDNKHREPMQGKENSFAEFPRTENPPARPMGAAEGTRHAGAAFESAPAPRSGPMFRSNGGSFDPQTITLGASQGAGYGAAAPEKVVPSADKNAWYQNNYLAGSGARESLEKAVSEGVVVNGERIKLETFAHTFKQDFPYPSDQSLAVTLRTDRSRLTPEGGQTFLQVGFQAAAKEVGDRPGLNVALVVDISGSMNQEGKIEAARSAARAVVNRLSARDKLSLITYSNTANVVVPLNSVSDKRRFISAIDAIGTDGGTNIFAGLELGYRQLENQKAGVNTSNLVLLITDGKVTAGVRETAQFEALAKKANDKSIETTTIGMGVDYEESLMIAIAKSGGGNYQFINSASEAPKVIANEIDELAQSIARAVKLRILLPQDVQLVRVLGSRELSKSEASNVKAEEQKIDKRIYDELGIVKDRTPDDEPGIKMLIPAFRANDSHAVLLELQVPPGTTSRKIADVWVKYKDLSRKKNSEIQQTLSVPYAKDKADAVASTVRSVKKNMLGYKTGEALMAASQSITQRRDADAIRAIDDQMTLLAVASREWKDSDLERDALLLGKYKNLLMEGSRSGFSPQLVAYLGKSFSYSAYQRTK